MPVIRADNLVLGTPYIDVGGKVTAKNLTTGAESVVEFHKRPWIGTGFKVNADIYDEKGKLHSKLEGTWDKEVSLVNPKS